MAMKLLTFHDQFVSHFASDDQKDNLVSLNIIQGAQVARPRLEFRERIWTQTLDRFRWRCGLVLQPGQDSCFQVSLVAHLQRP
jgi:hypothetical protein